MELLAGSRSRSLMLVIQRMRSCSSGAARGRRAFARPRAAESRVPPREGSESGVEAWANRGNFFIAGAALLRAGGDRDTAEELLPGDRSDPCGRACVVGLGDFDARRGALCPG